METTEAKSCVDPSAMALRRLVEEDAVGQLVRRDGIMRRLGSDQGKVKLDWVDRVGDLVRDDALLREIFMQASAILKAGIRHVLWSGMGGSVVGVQALIDLAGTARGGPPSIALYVCDSTDPATLSGLLTRIANAKGLATVPPDSGPSHVAGYDELLSDVMMIAVAMSATSEEPVSHASWFHELLVRGGLPVHQHLLIMAPRQGSLHRCAVETGAQLCDTHVGNTDGFTGRTSMPSTRVFLLPCALYLADAGETYEAMTHILDRAWVAHDLRGAMAKPGSHPYIALATRLSCASQNGSCQLLLVLPPAWRPMRLIVEQIMEQSLGKGGKGVVVFVGQDDFNRTSARLGGMFTLVAREQSSSGVSSLDDAGGQSRMSLDVSSLEDAELVPRLIALCQWLLGWQLTAALYGYLHDIEIAPEPAVELYKALSKRLRSGPSLPHLGAGSAWQDRLNPDCKRFASDLMEAAKSWSQGERRGYFDLTINGETRPAVYLEVRQRWKTICNGLLGFPMKLRRAPAEYHVSEQSEMDGPVNLVSLRIVNLTQEPVILGDYPGRYLTSQAVATWQAMNERGRCCHLLITDDIGDVGARNTLLQFLDGIEIFIRAAQGGAA